MITLTGLRFEQKSCYAIAVANIGLLQDQFHAVFLLPAASAMDLDDLDQPVEHSRTDRTPCPLQVLAH
jgi:hypothetical protein